MWIKKCQHYLLLFLLLLKKIQSPKKVWILYLNNCQNRVIISEGHCVFDHVQYNDQTKFWISWKKDRTPIVKRNFNFQLTFLTSPWLWNDTKVTNTGMNWLKAHRMLSLCHVWMTSLKQHLSPTPVPILCRFRKCTNNLPSVQAIPNVCIIYIIF